MLTPLLEKMLAERSTAIPAPAFIGPAGCFDEGTYIEDGGYLQFIPRHDIYLYPTRVDYGAHYDLRDMD